MYHRIQTALMIVALTTLLAARADDPSKKPDETDTLAQQARLKQEILQRRFRELELQLHAVAIRLEKSSRKEDREQAQAIRNALDLVGKEGIDGKFDKLISLLKKSGAHNISDVKEAIDRADVLTKNLRDLLAILTTANRDAELRAERERLEQLLRQITGVIRDQKRVQAGTERADGDRQRLKNDQAGVSKSTNDLHQKMGGKPGDRSKSDNGKAKDGGKPGSPSDKGAGKEGGKGDKGDSKSGGQADQGGSKSQGGGKSGQQSQGAGKGGAGGKQAPPQPEAPGRQKVQDAMDKQRQAEDQLPNPDAAKPQRDAIKDLQEAREEIKKRLEQVREEELERLLAQLINRCTWMLEMQKQVRDGTVSLDKAIADNADKKPGRANHRDALTLSRRENEIYEEAVKLLALLRSEGSAAAFPEVLRQVAGDMKIVELRLGKTDPGTLTVKIENDIIATLQELVDALKKAAQDLKKQQGGGGGGGGGGKDQKQDLIDLVAELKLVRNMQQRVNQRTLDIHQLYPHREQAAGADIQKDLKDLAERQDQIQKITRGIHKNTLEKKQ